MANSKNLFAFAIYGAPIFLLLLIGSIKSDAEIFLNSAHWSDFTNSAVVLAIKRNIHVGYLAGIIYATGALLLNKKVWIIISAPALAFLALYLFGALRVFPSTPDLSVRFLASFFVMSCVSVYLGSLLAQGGAWIAIVRAAFLHFSLALIGLNIFEHLTGNGYVEGFPRFFGTATHPNFIGVQMAGCCIIVWGALNGGGWRRKLALGAMLAGGLFVLYSTGSRTALVSFVAGIVVLAVLAGKITAPILALIAVCGLAGLLLIASGADLFAWNVYDRNGGNTRAEAWAAMWADIRAHPVWGLGHFPGYSENSLLRGWATLGIFYPIALIFSVSCLALQVLRYRRSDKIGQVAIFIGLFSGLTVGSIFEGYLLDANSYPLYAWYISLAVCGLYLRKTYPAFSQAAAAQTDNAGILDDENSSRHSRPRSP